MLRDFLEYVTVFRSRVAVGNLVLPIAKLSATRPETLVRKLDEKLATRIDVDLEGPDGTRIVKYFREKKLLGARPRASGRYRGLALVESGPRWRVRDSTGREASVLRVFETDIWFADERLRSTVGLPTPDNARESLDLCIDLDLISKSKLARTSAGQTALAMRSLGHRVNDNPFAMGLERVAFTRQVLQADGLILFELLRVLEHQPAEFRRDDLLPHGLIQAVTAAQESLRDLRARPDTLASIRSLRKLLEDTASASASKRRAKPGASVGPGVLEHRLSARLEWLTDIGLLTKAGLPKNSFTYRKTETLPKALVPLGRGISGEWSSDDIAIWLARLDEDWLWAQNPARVKSVHEAIQRAYTAIEMKIGPVPIREVCFIAAALLDRPMKLAELREELIAMAETSSQVKLAGDRYRRDPQMVRIEGTVAP